MSDANQQTLFGQGDGEGLDWAVQYAEFMEALLEDRRDKRPLKADIARVSEIMKSVTVTPWTREQVFSAVITKEIATFKDGDHWYALPSYEIATWMRDGDGGMPQAMIYENDVSQGETYEVAVKRCYVNMVLGRSIRVPADLV